MSEQALDAVLAERGLTLIAYYQPNCAAAQDAAGKAMVLKLIAQERDEFEREAGFAQLAAQHGIAPALHEARWLADRDAGLLVLERWDLSLEELLARPSLCVEALRRVQRALRRVLRALRQIGVVHADLLPKNIVVRLRGGRVDAVALIDWGLSFYAAEVGAAWWLGALVVYFAQLRSWPGHSAAALQAAPHLLDRHILLELDLELDLLRAK